MARRFLTVAAVVLALATLAARAGGARLPNVCTLLTNKEVAAAIGGRVSKRETVNPGVCTWSGPPAGFMQQSAELTVLLFREPKRAFEAAELNGRTTPIRSVGAGVLAFEDAAGVTAWKSGVGVQIVGGYATVYPRQGLKLAELVFERAA